MALWVVRAGKNGGQRDAALNNELVCHAWNELPDYSECKTKDDLRRLYKNTYPEGTEKQLAAGLGQVWRFAHEMHIGDMVALPLKPESAFEFGRVTGEYQFEKIAPNVMHIRKVKWLGKILRSALPQDLLISLSIPLTVYKVALSNADALVQRIIAGKPVDEETLRNGGSNEPELIDEMIDLDEAARDGILKFIQSNFKGHDLARLVDAVLRAQGYLTEVSPPGPDGGIDILAGSGPLGFDQPRLCVQVKSGSSPEGQKTLNELLGVVSKFNSNQGLLVSWGGFTNPVRKDAKKSFFTIRLWDQGNLVDAILQNYERLDEEIRAELPLKRIWAIVNEDAD